ncbi:DUF3783 domain-containing protein [Peptoniphilus equinus]|uniref:DUF3783 domain-containing protein n=1 Tax=Peptoniphilus equinus TaxID=3016343 RepID=A0ABY7QTH6_9FIRM|nr:DUF3783 domain-containing protein [Peptoniphilus equinus]WBW50089.1 DUF3783 domain-containing protein [Peptoniphilus equinus]
MNKQFFYYGFSPEREAVLQAIAASFDIDAMAIDDEDTNQKVGYIFGMEGFERTEGDGEAHSAEFVIFSSFDRNEMGQFLMALKEEGIVIPFKCVLTETNAAWTLSYLMAHVADEHETVLMYNDLSKLIKQAQGALDQNYDEALYHAIGYALSIRELTDLDKDDITVRYNKLEEVLRAHK